MEFQELIRQRYSVRAYRPDPVPDDLLRDVLEAARLAPTAHNNQPFRLVVMHTAGRYDDLRPIYLREWFLQAPLLICICGLAEQAWVRRQDGRSYLDIDIGIVFDHLTLAATAHGLGTCWIAAFDADAARQALRLPPEIEPIAFTPLGYPADARRAKQRRPLEELVHWETW